MPLKDSPSLTSAATTSFVLRTIHAFGSDSSATISGSSLRAGAVLLYREVTAAAKCRSVYGYLLPRHLSVRGCGCTERRRLPSPEPRGVDIERTQVGDLWNEAKGHVTAFATHVFKEHQIIAVTAVEGFLPRPSIVTHIAGQPIRTAVYGPVRTVVWEGSGREACPYPDSR